MDDSGGCSGGLVELVVVVVLMVVVGEVLPLNLDFAEVLR